jgi:hypothetical protein
MVVVWFEGAAYISVCDDQNVVMGVIVGLHYQSTRVVFLLLFMLPPINTISSYSSERKHPSPIMDAFRLWMAVVTLLSFFGSSLGFFSTKYLATKQFTRSQRMLSYFSAPLFLLLFLL